MGYTKTAIKGFSWLGAVRIVIRGLSFVKTLIIARVLTPTQFGVFGIVTLLLALIEIVTETGINIFLIQRKEEIEKYIPTAWVVSLSRGIIIAASILITAPFVANFFHSPSAYDVIAWSSLIPFIRGFINPSVIVLHKELQFKKEFYFRSTIILAETITSIIFVLLSHSVMGLIAGMVVSALLEVILSFIVIKPIPTFVFDKLLFKDIVHHGKWITGATIFNYFYQNGDNIVVGRILGTSSLGLYDMAYKISLAPMTDFADVIAKVTLPVYVKISDDTKRLRKAFFKTLGLVALIAFPIGFIISFFAKPIIIFVLGPEWVNATPALQVLGIFGAVRAVSFFAITPFYSIQKQHLVMTVSLVGLLGLGVTIVPFIMWWGLPGAGLSALFGTTITLPVTAYYLYKHLYYEKK
jgi:O-antigen/teichoic acid export membrane protein